MAELDIFLRFPETDEEIYALTNAPEQYREIVKNLQLVKSLARCKASPALTCRLCYSKENISNFIAKADKLFEEKHLHDIATSIRHILGVKNINILSQDSFKKDALYHNWNLSECQTEPSEDIIKAAAQKNIDALGNAAVQMLNGEKYHEREILPVVIDSFHHSEHPLLSIIKINADIDDLDELLASKSENGFSLKGNPAFQKTNYIYKPSNQNIYQKTNDNTYWYFDFFHKDNKIHYEVFDIRGDHIGEADQNGNLTPDSNDPGKKITKYLR